MSIGNIYIGTSGWSYPHWVGPFYPKDLPSGKFLGYYVGQFDTVEINNTFYHLPTREALTTWRETVPEGFVFACKGSRFITHMKKLKDPDQSIKRFFETIRFLRDKLGPILFQLPPRWGMNLPRLEAFLRALPGQYRYAFEFRDARWLADPTYRLLAKYNAACCLYHFAGHWAPAIETADFMYVRLHGPGGPYQGPYHQTVLLNLANKCTAWAKTGRDVYCYFDNDEKGYAAKDALRLKRLVMES